MTTKISTSNLDASVTTLIVVGGGPKVTAITYPGNDLAADIAGGQTVTLTGTGFVTGCSVFIGTVQVSVVTFISATSVTFTSPALAAATYTLYLVNPDGGTATIVPGISYSGTPAWTTAAGSLGSIYEYAAISNTVAATGDGSITYSVFSGTLPTSSSLNTSTGVITGTSPASEGATIYNFVIRATDAQLQDSDRAFSITVNIDPVTWSSPADNSTVTLSQNAASTTALSATSAAGKAITYTANTLPAGLSISGAAVTGTPTVLGNTTSTFTATAATTGRTATRTINWTVSVASDTYFPYTTLLLSGAVATETFVADASVNNFPLTIVGDTKPNNFNPYTPGYYSNYFDGNGDYLETSATTNLSGDFSVEVWVNISEYGANKYWILGSKTTDSFDGINIYTNGLVQIHKDTVATDLSSVSAVNINTWNHILWTRSSNTERLWLNGIYQASRSMSIDYVPMNKIGAMSYAPIPNYFKGYISNLRVLSYALYSTNSNFTPPTAPLTAITNTSLLTCQSNRFVDNSANLFTLTKSGDTKVNSFTPFVPNTAYAAYGSTYLNGTTDFLSVPNNAVFDFAAGNFTIEAWMYQTIAPSGVAYPIVSKYAHSPYSWSVGTYQGTWDVSIFYAGSSIVTLTSGTIPFALNTWNHVALTRNGANYVFYVNGIQIATSSNVQTISVSTWKVCIGSSDTRPFYYPGYISNVRIVKGVAVYTANFTPPTAPLTATQLANTNGNPSAAITGSATSLLTCQTNQPASNSVFLDSSTNAFAVTRAGNVSAGTFTPYGANWSNYFDGNTDNLTAPHNVALNLSTGNFTLEAWVYWTGTNVTGHIINKDGVSGSTYQSYSLGLIASKLGFVVGTGNVASYIQQVISPSNFPTNQWIHVAGVKSGTTLTVYQNGVSVATATQTGTIIDGGKPVLIGYETGQSQEKYWNGYISNVRIVKGVAVYTAEFTVPTAPLTAIANTGLLTCQSNSLVDNSANAFTITKTGDVAVQRFSPFSPQTQTAITHSAYFDGTTDYLATPSNAAFGFGTGDFTIECWIYPTGGGSRLLEFSSNTDNVDYSTSTGTIGYYNGSASVNSAGGLINANTWAHIAIVRLTGTVRVYVNGVLAVTQASTPNSSTRTLYIGGVTNGFYTGYISNARVVKGVAVYTANFTVPTAPLTATQSAGTNIAAITDTQTSLLTCQSPTFVDNSTNAFAMTAFGEAKPRTLNPFGFTNASAAYSAATYGGSAYFDGTTDSLAAPANSAFQFTGDYTVEFWVNFSSVATEVDLVGNYASNVGTDWMILKTSNGTFQYYPSSAASFINGPTPVANRWYHVAIGRSGASCKLYVDGILYGTALTFSGTLGDASKSVYIGSRGGSANILTGYISNVRIVKGVAVYTSNFVPPTAPLTAITNTSLLLNMTTSGIYDAASMSNLETVADAKLVATHTPYAGSFYSNYFDGTGDVFTVSNNSGFNFSSDFIIEAWLYPTAFGQGSCNFMTHWSSGSNVYVFRVLNNARVQFLYTAGATTLTGTSTTVSLNQWSHVAVCRSGSTLRIFVNGIADTTTATYSGTLTGGGPIAVGAHNDTSEGWTGYISNLRVVNTPSAPYTTTFTPSTTPLTSITGTALLTCQSNRFLDNSANAGTITKSGHVAVQSFNPFQRNSAATMYFDGTGDALAIPYNPAFNFGAGNFTIEFWMYVTATPSTEQYFLAVGPAGSGGVTRGWRMAAHNGTAAGIYFSPTGIGSEVLLGSFPNASAWHHIAIVRNSTTITGYVDGIALGTTINASTTAITDITSGDYSFVGGMHSSGATPRLFYNGYIDDLRITKGIARYPAASVPTTAFIAK